MASQRQDQWLFLLSITGSPGHGEPVMGTHEMERLLRRCHQLLAAEGQTTTPSALPHRSRHFARLVSKWHPQHTAVTPHSLLFCAWMLYSIYPDLCPRELLTTEGTEAKPGVPPVYTKAQDTAMGSTGDVGQCRREREQSFKPHSVTKLFTHSFILSFSHSLSNSFIHLCIYSLTQ